MSRLREVRVQAGLTLRQVSDGTGVKVPNLSLIERGLMGVTPRVAERLASFFGRDRITEEHLLYPERFKEVKAA